MRRYISIFVFGVVSLCSLNAQVLIQDFLANDATNNSNGIWRPRITAAPDGSFSVAWQDYSDRPGINSNTTGRSQIAVQRFSATAQPLEHIHFFRGESTLTWMWLFDYLEHAEIRYLGNGTLVVLMQHTGRFVIGTDDIASAEITLGAINANGQIIKLHDFGENVQYPLISTTSRRQDNPRLAVTPDNIIVAIFDESSYDSDYRNVAFRALDASLQDVISHEVPHSDGIGQAPHIHADAATNGQLYATVWQDGRNGITWDLSVQFYSPGGPVGTNYKINQTNPGAAHALRPSVAMNPLGQSVVAWVDTRNGAQIFGQLFDANGNAVGNNIQISETPVGGDIYSRPEVAIRDDGSFMVVWTDSTNAVQSFRARGRQFDALGNPLGEPFLLPAIDVLSGYPDIATDGSAYYVTWMDNRLQQEHPNAYAKKVGTIISSVDTGQSDFPVSVTLYPAYPNPFNPETTIRFAIPRRMHVYLGIYDLMGRKVKTLVDEELPAGEHFRIFHAEGLASGIYIYRMNTENFIYSKQVVLLK
jgi:hypothetical protein